MTDPPTPLRTSRAAGAKVLAREAPCGSKAHAMDRGLAVSDAEAVLFVDGDCIGLTASHLDAICEPFVDGRAAMSIGVFDYGWLRSWLVLRWPPLTGERIIPRWVWDAIPEEKLDGYTIEVRINEVVAEHRLPTAARTMRGVSHRTKRDKHGRREGVRRTWAMYREVVATIWPFGDVRARTHWFYLRALTIEGD